jgi:hypothetical protein
MFKSRNTGDCLSLLPSPRELLRVYLIRKEYCLCPFIKYLLTLSNFSVSIERKRAGFYLIGKKT